MNGLLLLIAFIMVVCLTACDDKKPVPPVPTAYKLTIVFVCDPEDGCGDPPSVTFDKVHPNKAECDAVGQLWMSPQANPSGALERFVCAP